MDIKSLSKMFIKSTGNTVRLLNKNNGAQMARQRHRNAKTTALFLPKKLGFTERREGVDATNSRKIMCH